MDEVFKKQNFGNKIGFGNKAALVVVDFVVGFADPQMFGGGNIQPAIDKTVELLAAFRDQQLPIAFTRVVYAEDGSDAGYFTAKVPSLKQLTDSHPASQIVPELKPHTGEYVINKTQASAFFGTNFAPWLVTNSVDTLVITGCTTSGCVRATAVDSVSYNFRTIIAKDCVGDRALAPHEASLFDLEMKYADMISSEELVREIQSGKLGQGKST
ncbi:MAG: isochorismatase family protein [Methyloligellaceae bacterium]